MKRLLGVTVVATLLIFFFISAELTPVTSQEQTPYFKLHLSCANNIQDRMIWSAIIAAQLDRIGIDAQLHYNTLEYVFSRSRNVKPELVGATYEQGGYDMQFMRKGVVGAFVDPASLLLSTRQTPPENYYYYNNQKSDELLLKYRSSPDPKERLDAIRKWQQLAYDDLPMICLLYPNLVFAINPKLEGFDAIYVSHFPPKPFRWNVAGKEKATVVMQATEDIVSFNPVYMNNIYGMFGWGTVLSYLATYDNWQNKNMVPQLAVEWNVSPDGKTIVINLRQGVKWHTGVEFTAEDVKYTWDLLFNKEVGAYDWPKMKSILLDPRNYKVTGSHQITVTLPEFNFVWPMILTAYPILPKHVLEGVPSSEMKKHPFNTGVGTYEVQLPSGTKYLAKGPVGTGPYVFEGLDTAKRTVTTTRFKDYFETGGGNVETFKIVIIIGADAAIAALKKGEIDVITAETSIESKADTIDPSWGKVVRLDSLSWQMIEINHRHPVFGTGVDTPLGRRDPSRAGEAARYVRQAINLVIPRDLIVRDVAAGFGTPGVVACVPPAAPEFDNSLPPIPYDVEKARELMVKAGYPPLTEEAIAPSMFPLWYAIAAVAVVVAVALFFVLRKRLVLAKTTR